MTSGSLPKKFNVGRFKHKPSVAIVDTRLKIRNMYLSYKQNPYWMIQKTRDNKSWEAVDIPETDSKLKNHIFQSLDEVQQILDPSASSDPSCSFFLTDKSERIISDLKMSDFYHSPQTTSKKTIKKTQDKIIKKIKDM